MITATRYRAAAEIALQGKLAQQIARAQSDISTEKRIQVASDDPIAAARVAEIRSAQADQTGWKRNIETAQAVASQVDTQLTGVADAFDRVKELVLAGNSQSVSPNDRAALVQELNEIKTTVTNLAAAKTPTGQSLFPTDAPLLVSVSATLHLPATAKASDVFGNVDKSTGGTHSLTDVIDDAIAAISQTDPDLRSAAAATSLADIDLAQTHITSQRSAQGVRAARLDSAQDSLASAGLLLSEERSSLEDTDVASTVLKLNAKTLSLQAAQAAFARVNRNTLFDLLS
jgi:flagellar hook-associated protein 3 FlgL